MGGDGEGVEAEFVERLSDGGGEGEVDVLAWGRGGEARVGW